MIRTLALGVGLVAVTAQQCEVTLEGATFNLDGLHRSANEPYRVRDKYDEFFTYQFGVCGAVDKPTSPENCTQPIPGDPVPAYQVDSRGLCNKLSNNDPWTWGGYDSTFKGRGISLKYTGGDICHTTTPAGVPKIVNRELTLALECDPKAVNNVFDGEEAVKESDTCKYTVFLNTIHACPTECWSDPTPTSEASICNGHGVCAYDNAASTARCFCNSGRAGGLCQDKAEKESSGGIGVEGAFLVIVCLLLAAVLSMVFFMVNKLRKLSVNPDAYQGLQGRFNELGMLA